MAPTRTRSNASERPGTTRPAADRIRVSELAQQAGISVDTIRYYQAKGLLPAPTREGRLAYYDDTHLARLQRIRELADDGLSLAVIKRLLDGAGAVDPQLLDAIDSAAGAGWLSRAELATASGVPEPLLLAAESSGLIQAYVVNGESRYAASDVEMVQAGLRLLGYGMPLDELLSIGVRYAEAVDDVAERAVELFNTYIRKSDQVSSAEDVVDAFSEMLPAVTTLVAQHFQRSLIAHGRARLAASGDTALADAIAAAPNPRLDIQWP